MVEYPDGDQVAYITTAYECHLLNTARPDMDELFELGWFSRDQILGLDRRDWILGLDRRDWIDRVINDCA